jgi:hypothetical protein
MMGAREDLPPNTTEKLSLVRWYLYGDYDKNGSYWGKGEPLYRAMDGEGRQRFVRANSRDDAKRQFPNAKFYR